MTFTSSSIEIAFLWNMQHGLLGSAAKQYITDHPDHEDALLRVFRLGGNDLVKDLIERGADVTAFQPADVVPLTVAAAPDPKPTWREQVKNEEHYLLAFALAGALIRNGVVDIDMYDVHWHHTFENIVSSLEDALNLFNT